MTFLKKNIYFRKFLYDNRFIRVLKARIYFANHDQSVLVVNI